jgi:hypothetical protein
VAVARAWRTWIPASRIAEEPIEKVSDIDVGPVELAEMAGRVPATGKPSRRGVYTSPIPHDAGSLTR